MNKATEHWTLKQIWLSPRTSIHMPRIHIYTHWHRRRQRYVVLIQNTLGMWLEYAMRLRLLNSVWMSSALHIPSLYGFFHLFFILFGISVWNYSCRRIRCPDTVSFSASFFGLCLDLSLFLSHTCAIQYSHSDTIFLSFKHFYSSNSISVFYKSLINNHNYASWSHPMFRKKSYITNDHFIIGPFLC